MELPLTDGIDNKNSKTKYKNNFFKLSKTMKRFILMFVAIFAMVLAANAADYTGTVSNVYMGGKQKSNATGITYTVESNELSGTFTIPNTFPSHTIDMTSDLTKSTNNTDGTVTVFGISLSFTGTVSNVSVSTTSLSFHFEGTTSTGTSVSFDFDGTATSSISTASF